MRLSLRPWPGRRLPRDLRPGAVAQQAAAFPGGLRDPQLATLLTRIDTGRFHRPTRVEVFFEGHLTFRAAFAAIDAAEHEVLLESYIIRDDSTGRAALEALARATARGVVVKVLVDAWGSWATRSAFWEEMRRRGIAVRLFHPLWAHWRRRANRDHRKILVVDRQVAFLGGMNVADEYGSSWGSSRETTSDENWRDTHARLEGSVARELAAVFQEGWTRAGGKPFDLGLEPEAPGVAAGARALVVDTRAGRGQREKVNPEANLVRVLGLLGLDLDETLMKLLPATRAKAGVVVAVNTGEGPLWPEAPQPGDVIYALNKELVASVEGLRTAASKLKPGDPVVLLVERQGELLYLAAVLE